MKKTILTTIITLWLLAGISQMSKVTQGEGVITLTNGNSKNAKLVKIMGVTFNNGFLKDDAGTYALTGSIAILRSNDKKKVIGKILTLGNSGGEKGKQNAYAIALNLPANAQKGLYTLRQSDDGGIAFAPKGKQIDVEYVLKSATINIVSNDGKKISGEINGSFILLHNSNKAKSQQINISKLLFNNLEILDSSD